MQDENQPFLRQLRSWYNSFFEDLRDSLLEHVEKLWALVILDLSAGKRTPVGEDKTVHDLCYFADF